MPAPLAEIYIDEAGTWEPLDVRPSTPAPIVPYQPPPSAPPSAIPNTPRVYVPTSDYFDPSKPNHVNVEPRDWTPEVRDLNDKIHDELEAMGRDAVADAEWRDYIGGRRGRNLAGQIMDAIPLVDDAAAIAGVMEGVTRATGIPVMPHQTAGALLNPNDGFLDFLNPLNWFGNNAPVEQGTFEGEILLEGGQGNNVNYSITANSFASLDGDVRLDSTNTRTARGPLRFVRVSTPTFKSEQIRDRNNNIVLQAGQGGGEDAEIVATLTIIDISRVDGLPDTDGDQIGPPVDRPTPTQPYQPTDFTDPASPTVPGVDPRGFPDVFPDIPTPDGDNPVNPDGENPFPDGEPDSPGEPDVNPDDPNDEGEDGSDDDNRDCCEKIDYIYDEMRTKFTGDPCEEDEESVGYSGQGMVGLELAIRKIWDMVKCESELNASLPTHWETKVGEIPQLIVQWKRVSGGSSRWDFHIPHPLDSITKDYAFDFPDYKKGSYQATMKLSDNSSVRINALNRDEAGKIMRYIRTLIKPSFLISYKDNNFPFVGSELNRTMVEDEVSATYVKSFAGHLTTAPLWTKRLS